ncbi:MAG: DUF2974 domain-containing protein [Clostridia bacterium]|nr:DUF2974 domain-containing protein [Clostridia bacterium]
MDTLYDYVSWYADVSFLALPLRTEDTLVFSYLAYEDYTPVLKGLCADNLRSLLRYHLAKMPENDPAQAEYKRLIRAISDSSRFGDLRVLDFQNVLDVTEHTQFAALTLEYASGQVYISFRGTDQTIDGWREDFMLSFMETEGQRLALAYLRKNLDRFHRLTVGGHSKGGNLAMYAASHLSDEDLRCIDHIYIHDAPGFCSDVMDVSLLQQIRNMTTSVTPSFSVIGRLFDPHIPDVTIVPSTKDGIMQHDPVYWGMEHGELISLKKHDPSSEYLHEAVEDWLSDCDASVRRDLTNQLFDGLSSDGSMTLEDLSRKGLPYLEKRMLSTIQGLSPISKMAMLRAPLSILFGRRFGKIRASSLARSMKNENVLPSLLMLVIGILLLLLPNHTMSIVLAITLFATGISQVIYTLRILSKGHWDLRGEQVRVNLCLILLAMNAVILFKDQALFNLSSTVFGVLFWTMGYRHLARGREARRHSWPRRLNLLAVFLYFLSGLQVLFARADILEIPARSAGRLMIIDAVFGLSAFLIAHLSAVLNARRSQADDA